MSIQMSEGFSLLSKEALDKRVVYKTIAEMKAMEDYMLYDGILATIEGDNDKKTYQWWSSNAIDATLGKWREFNGTGSSEITDYVAGIKVNNETVEVDESKIVNIDLTTYVKQSDLDTTNENVINLQTDLTTLTSKAGVSLGLSVDDEFVMTLQLKNGKGEVLDTQTFDFPIESAVVGGSYKDGKLTLTLQNGTTIPDIDISSLVTGLVENTFTIAGIDMVDDITKDELLEALGVSGSGTLVNPITSTITIGGINKNESFDTGTSLEDIIKKLLTPDVKPTLKISTKPTTFLYEKGSNCKITEIGATITKGTASVINDITITQSNSSAPQDLTITVGDVSSINSETYFSTTTDFTITENDKITLNMAYKYDSDSESTETLTDSFEYKFVNPIYYGVLSDTSKLNETDMIANLKKMIVENKVKTVSYTTENQIMVYAYPSSYGALKSIIDTATNYQLNWTSTNVSLTLNGESVDYLVYYSTACKVTNYNVSFS